MSRQHQMHSRSWSTRESNKDAIKGSDERILVHGGLKLGHEISVQAAATELEVRSRRLLLAFRAQSGGRICDGRILSIAAEI